MFAPEVPEGLGASVTFAPDGVPVGEAPPASGPGGPAAEA